MTKQNVPLSLTVNVSIAKTPTGLGEYNTNTVCLFTNEAPNSIENYLWAVNARDVENVYGTNSLTTKMAKALFTPVPNLRTGNGQLLVFHYDATNATATYTETKIISSNIISALKEVVNGNLTIKIGEVTQIKTGLNFSNITDIDDVVKVLANANFDCDINVVESKIRFTARVFGADGDIELQSTSGGGVDIYGSDFLDGENQTKVSGTNETGTTLSEAIAQADEIGYYSGILTTQSLSNAGIVETAQTVQTLDHIYYEVVQGLNNISELGGAIKQAGLTKTRLLAKTDEGTEVAKRAIATYSTIAQSTNYSGSNTALTMNLKELTGILPDFNINTTYYNLGKINGVDVYGSTEGLSCVYSFDNGYYTDDATNLLALKKGLEVSGFNYLRKTNTKIPQTETGMTGLKNAYETRLQQYVRNGVIGQGLQWNDSIPFGDPEDFQRNIEEKGYYIYSLPIAQQQQSEREERIAPVVQIAIKTSGAIHSSNVIVQVQR